MLTPTKTTNRLHLEDLDPMRFEDLTVALLYGDREWASLNHDGRAGSDDGIDVRADEQLEDGTRLSWAVQCKRCRKFTSADARRAVDEALDPARPIDVLLLVVACSVSLKARRTFQAHAEAKGIPTTMLWSSSEVEALLYAKHPDLLFVYFDIRSNGPPTAPHPADVHQLRQYRSLITHHEHVFLTQHDFGSPVRYANLKPLNEIADSWLGVRFEFRDLDLRPLFDELLRANRSFMDIVVERLYPSDVSVSILIAKTDIDRERGLTDTTRQAIREMNRSAVTLLRANQAFERAAVENIRIA